MEYLEFDSLPKKIEQNWYFVVSPAGPSKGPHCWVLRTISIILPLIQCHTTEENIFMKHQRTYPAWVSWRWQFSCI